MLTDKAIQALKPRAKSYRVADGNSLFLQVTPSGGKNWHLRYRWQGKERLLSMGNYPQTKAQEARQRARDARQLLEDGTDPSAARKAEREVATVAAATTFDLVADEFLKIKCVGMAEATITKKHYILDRYLRPWLGNRPIDEITVPEVLTVIRKIELRGAHEVAHRGAQLVSQICRYAVQTGRADRNPASDLRGALTPVSTTHHAAITDPHQLGAVMQSIDGYSGTYVVTCAMRMAPYVAVRPGELRSARWADIDLDSGTWSYLMPKVKTSHIVPLAPQVVAILTELKRLTGNSEFVFPAMTSNKRPMSENAINYAYRRLGIPGDELVAHGWRATFRTMAAEQLNARIELLEMQLGHRVADPMGRAYNRTQWLDERRAMMTRWAAYLDKLKLESGC